ncbi:MAG: protein-L-isoaspartate O-methyltransferase [Parasphingorhabdus sp.]|nr:protein-L-isoaspartate O-methyltransferase [Parasphingorhabdus sp.]
MGSSASAAVAMQIEGRESQVGHEHSVMPPFAMMRKAMIDSQLRPSTIDDPRLLKAIAAISRENFVPAALRSVAYCDRSLPLDSSRSLNPPLTTASLIDAVAVTASDNVLLIGAATGYAAAILAQMAASVTALEEDGALSLTAAPLLAGLSNVVPVVGPLTAGWAQSAPYDVLIIDGAIPALPDALADQLADGGRCAAAFNEGGTVRLGVGIKSSGIIGFSYFADGDAAALPGFAAPKGFSF